MKYRIHTIGIFILSSLIFLGLDGIKVFCQDRTMFSSHYDINYWLPKPPAELNHFKYGVKIMKKREPQEVMPNLKSYHLYLVYQLKSEKDTLYFTYTKNPSNDLDNITFKQNPQEPNAGINLALYGMPEDFMHNLDLVTSSGQSSMFHLSRLFQDIVASYYNLKRESYEGVHLIIVLLRDIEKNTTPYFEYLLPVNNIHSRLWYILWDSTYYPQKPDFITNNYCDIHLHNGRILYMDPGLSTAESENAIAIVEYDDSVQQNDLTEDIDISSDENTAEKAVPDPMSPEFGNEAENNGLPDNNSSLNANPVSSTNGSTIAGKTITFLSTNFAELNGLEYCIRQNGIATDWKNINIIRESSRYLIESELTFQEGVRTDLVIKKPFGYNLYKDGEDPLTSWENEEFIIPVTEKEIGIKVWKIPDYEVYYLDISDIKNRQVVVQLLRDSLNQSIINDEPVLMYISNSYSPLIAESSTQAKMILGTMASLNPAYPEIRYDIRNLKTHINTAEANLNRRMINFHFFLSEVLYKQSLSNEIDSFIADFIIMNENAVKKSIYLCYKYPKQNNLKYAHVNYCND